MDYLGVGLNLVKQQIATLFIILARIANLNSFGRPLSPLNFESIVLSLWCYSDVLDPDGFHRAEAVPCPEVEG